jgi:hypothetical protein
LPPSFKGQRFALCSPSFKGQRSALCPLPSKASALRFAAFPLKASDVYVAVPLKPGLPCTAAALHCRCLAMSTKYEKNWPLFPGNGWSVGRLIVDIEHGKMVEVWLEDKKNNTTTMKKARKKATMKQAKQPMKTMKKAMKAMKKRPSKTAMKKRPSKQ